MNPVAKIARAMCLDYVRGKGLDPADSEDSDEASEALRATKQSLRDAVERLSRDDVRQAGCKRKAKRPCQQTPAAASTRITDEQKYKKEKKEKKNKKDKKAKKSKKEKHG